MNRCLRLCQDVVQALKFSSSISSSCLIQTLQTPPHILFQQKQIEQLRKGVQLNQAALGPPGADAPRGSSTRSCSMTTSTPSHKAWTDKGGHVTRACDAEMHQMLEDSQVHHHPAAGLLYA